MLYNALHIFTIEVNMTLNSSFWDGFEKQAGIGQKVVNVVKKEAPVILGGSHSGGSLSRIVQKVKPNPKVLQRVEQVGEKSVATPSQYIGHVPDPGAVPKEKTLMDIWKEHGQAQLEKKGPSPDLNFSGSGNAATSVPGTPGYKARVANATTYQSSGK
jgi:hypothetical protein